MNIHRDLEHATKYYGVNDVMDLRPTTLAHKPSVAPVISDVDIPKPGRASSTTLVFKVTITVFEGVEDLMILTVKKTSILAIDVPFRSITSLDSLLVQG